MIAAWSNDTAYEQVFAEQLANRIEAGDVAIGISTSGNSPNVINALRLAKRVGAVTIGLLGARGGKSETWVMPTCSPLVRILSRKKMHT